jgi:hypothetical protein
MATDTDAKGASPSEIKPREEDNPGQEEFQELDEKDMTGPMNEAPEESDNLQENKEVHDEAEPPADMDAGEQEITTNDADQEVGNDPDGEEIDRDPNAGGEEVEEPIESDDPPELNPGRTADAAVETPGGPDEDIGKNSDDGTPEDEPVGDDKSSEETDPAVVDPEKEAAENDAENDFGALTDDDVGDDADNTPKEEKLSAETAAAQKDGVRNEDEKNVSESKPPDAIKKTDAKEITPLKTAVDVQQGKPPAKGMSIARKVIAASIIILLIAGYTIYNNPAVIGLGGEKEPASAVQAATRQPVEPAEVQVQKPKPAGKQQGYLARLQDVKQLREQLLAKREEIYRLKLHYRDGIIDLQDQISREMQRTRISSLPQALKNKRIELNLRTIQRRQNYIQELEKPDQWAHKGSEELLYLKRKAELDLQMADVASGIDLERHMRYINAAIQKYQPSAEKLAIDPLPVELTHLESIWDQIILQQADKARSPVKPEDEKIIAEICSGDLKRIAELSTITTKAARCLASMSGSDLFLNGLTQVSPEDAKYLFQWKGNWICLNSIKELSPAAARYLFKWDGSWISLNGLTEFPPELAVYLMEWKGSQLELMGLNCDKAKPDRKALKYLALWETMGGKLFVSDGVRKQMEQMM